MLEGLIKLLQEIYDEKGEIPVYLNLHLNEGSSLLNSVLTIETDDGHAVVLTTETPSREEE